MVAGCVARFNSAGSMHHGCNMSFDGTRGFPGEGPPGARSSSYPLIWTTEEWGRQLTAWEPARPFAVDSQYGRRLLSALSRARVPR